MEEKQIADYFVVAGLTPQSIPLEDFSFDGNQLKSTYDQAPITDVAVIIPAMGEGIPIGYTCVEFTPTGLVADLNYGSIRSPEVYLCYRRGRDKPPLCDIGVLYQGKEQLMSDSEVVLSTPYGRSANVNNSTSQQTFVTYRRALETAPCNDLVVSDICVVITSKGESPPHAYCMIKKNLNKGMLGSDVFLCYKKSMNKPRYIAYRPGIQLRYPEEDLPNNPMPDSVPLFCLPMGATLEWWPISAATPKPVFSTFVLTVSDAAEKIYGSAITFYERYPEEKMSKEQRAWLDMEDVPSEPPDYTINTIKSICILSHWPFFDTFEKFLRFLHKMAHSNVPLRIPLERYITHFLHEIPFPSPQRPRILVQLSSTDRIALAQPEDLPLPRRGASFRNMLLNLGPDGCMLLLLLTLTEQKMLIHSLRPDVLTATAEALASSIFPFKWQCPYIPLCPLGLSDVLNAPVPYLIGVDSRFFDMYDPPSDVSCVDLDTNTISVSEEKKSFLNVKILPKKAARNLRSSLQNLHEKIYLTYWSERNNKNPLDDSLDKDIKTKKKELMLELEIQEAFLKFMASILRGYRAFLLPITKAPTEGATDPDSLFDHQGFIRSRDKAYVKFYSLVMKTQMFIRFIEERSFVSDMDSSLAFFDECSDMDSDSDARLLELDDSHESERTVFVMPPEPADEAGGVKTYTYEQFGTLDRALLVKPKFEDHHHEAHPMDPSLLGGSLIGALGASGLPPGSPMARRTKHEIKASQKFARKYAETPMLWAKCLLSTCFSIWYIHLPSLVLSNTGGASSKISTLRSAYAILGAMQKLRVLPADEVCYRVMMQLCGQHSQPVLAVKVLFEMKRHGVQPNAITYGFYNKAVLEAAWSSDMTDHSRLLWNKLRNVVTAGALFKRAGRAAAQRRLTSTQYSSTDEGDGSDGLSRTSVESSSGTTTTATQAAPIVYRNSTVASSQSDVGYGSMKEEQAKLESSAGVLMSSLGGDAGLLLSPVEATELKAALVSPIPPATQTVKGATLPREKVAAAGSPSGGASAGGTSSPSSRTGSVSTASLFRSASVRLGEMLVAAQASPLVESHLNPAKAALAGRLQWARSSIRKKLDMDTPSTPPNPKEDESQPESGGNGAISPNRMTLTSGDPLGALDVRPEEPQPKSVASPPPLPKAGSFVVPSPEVRLFTNGTTSDESEEEEEEDDESEEDDSSVTDDSSCSEEEEEEEPKLALNRSTGMRWSLRKPEFPRGVNTLGAQQLLGTALNSLSPQNLNARKAELLVGLSNLKSAATSVAKKFEEIKGSIGVAGTALTPGGSKLSSSGLLAAETGELRSVSSSSALEGSELPPLESWSSWTAQWLRRASSADLAAQQYSGTTGSATPSELSATDGQASSSNSKGSPSWTETSSLLDRLCASMRSGGPKKHRRTNSSMDPAEGSTSTAVEVSLTSCSKCHNCLSILYDEEIMAGWTPEDSNLNSRCAHCRKPLVPFLTIHLKDFRAHPPVKDQDPLNAIPTPSPAPKPFGPITVPYLSPLVLRRELENVLETEGDVCMTLASFVDQHPILYWNMLWYFERVGLISHLASLILKANVGLNEKTEGSGTSIDPSWNLADERNVTVRTMWDNPRLHDEIGAPAYALWTQTSGAEQQSSLVSALVTEHQPFPRPLLEQLLSGIQYNDMLRPLKLLTSELMKRKTKSGSIARHHGIYRELLFLSFVAIGRENIDQIAFDREYRLAYDRLDSQSVTSLGRVDSPPSIASVFCRHFFRQLEL